MASPKRPNSSDSSTSTSASPSKKPRPWTPDSDKDERALETIIFKEPPKKGPLDEPRRMKERIAEAERELELFDVVMDMLLLKDPAAELLELAEGMTKGDIWDGEQEGMMEGMWEAS